MQIPETDEIIIKLAKDLRKAAETLTPNEARFLVDTYYKMQEDRIRAGGQIRSMKSSEEKPVEEPHGVIQWIEEKSSQMEQQVKAALDVYSQSKPVGVWARSVVGIGPVIAAGLLAHIDITRAPTVGHIWRFAGLDPTVKWEKKTKRPWNASLKTLCWKIGESFVKLSGRDDCFYGKLYLQRKAIEIEKNERREFAAQAEQKLKDFKIGKDTDAYKAYSQGMLPPAHIHSRAKRWAVKLFLAHSHDQAYRDHYKTEPPKPYAIAILGHAHQIDPQPPVEL